MDGQSQAQASVVADMGHGQIVQLSPVGTGRWQLAFSEAGKPDDKAPPTDEIKIEAIDQEGMVHPLMVVAGPNGSTVAASGRTENAQRARIMVMHGTHFHTREVGVPGAKALGVVPGPNGGSLIDMGHDNPVEVTPVGEGRWQLHFLAREAPPPAEVQVEAICGRCEESQVRELLVVPGPDAKTLIASGRTQDCTHIRLALVHGDHFHTRSVPVANG